MHWRYFLPVLLLVTPLWAAQDTSSGKAPFDQVTVAIEDELDSLSEGHPGGFYLIISNMSSDRITVSRIINQARPPFLKLYGQFLPPPFDVEPWTARTLKYKFEFDNQMQPVFGRHPLLLSVYVKRELNGAAATGSLLVSHNVTYKALGETEVLKVLSIPSILLLPGFLVFVTFLAAWNWHWRDGDINQMPLKPSSPEFWLVTIGASLLLVRMYPAIAKFFGGNLDLFTGYTLADLNLIWFFSIALGLLVAAASCWAFHWWRVPQESDSEFDCLRKLGHRKAAPYLPVAQLGGSYKGKFLFVIGERRDEFWLAPQIIYNWIDKDPRKDEKKSWLPLQIAYQWLKKDGKKDNKKDGKKDNKKDGGGGEESWDLSRQLDNARDWKERFDVLKKANKKGKVKLRFDEIGEFKGVVRRNKQKLGVDSQSTLYFCTPDHRLDGHDNE